MRRTAFVLVHSPVVGPSTWAPVAGRFRAAGFVTSVPDLTSVAGAPAPRWRYAVEIVETAVHALDATEVVLVGHSGAGPLLPAVGERVGVASAHVFVDAPLPPPAMATPLSSPQHLASLAALAVDGVLPPWSEWWPPGTMEMLVADEVVRQRIEAELPRMPLDYFRESVPAARGWSDARGAYLRLSPPYEDDAARAEARGWPTERLDVGHLHVVNDAHDVTARIGRLLGLPVT